MLFFLFLRWVLFSRCLWMSSSSPFASLTIAHRVSRGFSWAQAFEELWGEFHTYSFDCSCTRNRELHLLSGEKKCWICAFMFLPYQLYTLQMGAPKIKNIYIFFLSGVRFFLLNNIGLNVLFSTHIGILCKLQIVGKLASFFFWIFFPFI